MKITNIRRMSGSITNNEQNCERHIILQAVFFHFSSIAIQEAVLGEEPGHPCLLIAPAEHRQCVLLMCSKAVGRSLCWITKGVSV